MARGAVTRHSASWPAAGGHILSADDLQVAFGATTVLCGARVDIGEAEIVSVMGPSGSGKSTFLACLAGLVRPDSGRVVFQGVELGGLSESRRSAMRLHNFGFVFQFGDLVPELSLVENVELPLRFGGSSARSARSQAQDALDLLGVGSLAARRTFAVSGGELQRAAVARALVHSPAVIFGDEPTGSLDESNGELVLDAFLHAAKVRRAAVVLATHDPSVAAVADRRVELRDGLVEAQR